MMNKLLLVSFFMIILVNIYAQKDNYGFAIGANYSHYLSYTKGLYYETGTRPAGAYVIGLIYNRVLTERYKLNTGLNYVEKNSQYEIIAQKSIDPSITGFPKGDTRRGYIQIPITIAYSKKKHWDFYGGVFLGRAICNFKNPKPIYFGFYPDIKVYPEYKNWDNGVQGGVAYKLGRLRVNFDISRTLSTNVVLNRFNHHFRTGTISVSYLVKKQ